MNRTLLPRLAKRNVTIPEALPEMDNLEEVRTMLAETAEGWTRECEAAMLTRLLQRRFGNLPSWATERIAQADLATLEEWGLRILEVGSLDEVLAG
ncbi:MAG: DUF4351 domain-containing protein [Magnetococcus sp. YQC-9]